jgi:hypothetical protein
LKGETINMKLDKYLTERYFKTKSWFSKPAQMTLMSIETVIKNGVPGRSTAESLIKMIDKLTDDIYSNAYNDGFVDGGNDQKSRSAGFRGERD